MPLAFAPFGWWPLAVVSPACLFAIWLDSRPRRAAWRGWLFGLGAFGVGTSWVRESFQFADVPGWLAVVLMVVFVAAFALYPALLGLLAARRDGRGEVLRLIAAMPAGWVLLEWLRGWLFTGFPWLQLGAAHVDSALGAQLPVGGVLLASWSSALVAGLAVWTVLAARRRRRGPALAACGLAVALWSTGLVLERVDWGTAAGEPLTVSLVQGNVAQGEKWLPEMRGPTLERYVRLTRERWARSDLVIWPETAVPGLRSRLGAFVSGLDAEARSVGSRVLFGIPVREDGRFFNGVEVVGEDSGVYHKRHLVPFGEYLPFDPLLRPLAEAFGVRVASFTPGPREQPMLEVSGHRLGVTICFEIAFASEVMRALPQAAFLVTVSNDAWFGTSIGPHQHFQLARVRARESARYLARATNTGISAVIDPAGGVVALSPQFRVHALSERIVPMRGETPYARLGDAPVVLLALAATIVGCRRRRRP